LAAEDDMGDKFDTYTDVITRLAKETVKCSPGAWEKGALSIQCDGVRLTYQLKNGDHPDKALLSETLRDQIDELYIRMRDAGDVWTSANLHWWREESDLKYNVDFGYPQLKQADPATASKPKGPWWKLGHQ
jgi:predicted Rdx family selenoprotein